MGGENVAKGFLISIALAAMIFIDAGCCGVVYTPTVGQVNGWVAEGIPPGTSVEAATAFLKSKGFQVREDRTAANRRELVADRRVGICVVNATYDYIAVRSDVDESGHLLSSEVTHETRPGI
jgi:hypothetical protein